jgi:EAL domain-containing protein (putative c-di-GMP-specific phosphodiesterase class I)
VTGQRGSGFFSLSRHRARVPTTLPAPFTMAFQPIVDASARAVFAYEALVRGVGGQPADTVLAQVDRAGRHAFDLQAWGAAMALAAARGLAATPAGLLINFAPNAVADPERSIERARAAAEGLGLARERIIFEFTESERIEDPALLARIVAAYRAAGFRTAIDDFGAGHSGLSLLAAFQPDMVKLDMSLVRGLDGDPVRRRIVAAVRGLCEELGVALIAEGVESVGEYAVLRELGVSLLQGYLFARPAHEALPAPAWPEAA